MIRAISFDHLRSWAGFCPRNDQRAGRHRSTCIRKGAPRLKAVLVQASWAAVRTRSTYLRAQFLRLRSRRGPWRAMVAVAWPMLGAISCLLRDGAPYRALGSQHLDQADKIPLIHRLVNTLGPPGCEVKLQQAA